MSHAHVTKYGGEAMMVAQSSDIFNLQPFIKEQESMIRISRFAMTLGLIVLAVPAFADHGWSNYHWARSGATTPASITVYDATYATSYANWPQHFQTALSDWDKSAVLALSTAKISANKRCGAKAGAVIVCNSTYGNNGWLGLAQIWLSGGHISQGTSKMNDTYFNSTRYPKTEQLHVMCQEVGHDFGLGHTSENGTSQNTCMDYYQNKSDSDTTSTHPNAHDYAQLETQHHWGTANSVGNSIFATAIPQGFAAPAFLGMELDQPWQWGTPIEWDHDGHVTTFRLNLGPDHTGHNREILTHTYPAHELLDEPVRPESPSLQE